MVENTSRMFNYGIVKTRIKLSNIFNPKRKAGNIRKIFARFDNYVTGQSNGFAEGLNISILARLSRINELHSYLFANSC